jgi:thiol:disulfide interchange protein DsbD
MEKLTFSDAHIQQRFADMVLLQADVTANDGDDKALLKRFNLFGPPGIIFFDKSGKEIGDGRVVGYQDADKFALSLARVFQRDAG